MQILNDAETMLRFPARPHHNDMLFDEVTGDPTHPVYRRILPTGVTIGTGPAPFPPMPTQVNVASPKRLRSRQLSISTVAGALGSALAAATSQPAAPATPTSTITTGTTAPTGGAGAPAPPAAAPAFPQYDDIYMRYALSDAGNILYEKHLTEYDTSLKEAIQSDNDLLQFLLSTHSAESKLSIQASPLSVPYPANCFSKSLLFWRISKSIHQTGGGAVKFKRTKDTFQMVQGDMRHEAFMDAIAKAQKNLNSDFGTLLQQPGHALDGKYVISVDHVMSLVYLNGVDQKFFAHQLNKTLDLHPDGKIDDTSALIRSFHAFQVTHDLTTPASQARDKSNRVLAATVPSTVAATVRPDGKTGCTICYDMGFTKKCTEHSNATCHNNKDSPSYNEKLHQANIKTAAKFKTAAKTGAKPIAAVATAVDTPVVSSPIDDIFQSHRFRALQAYMNACPVNTVARTNAAADLAAFIESGGKDESSTPQI